MHKKNMPNHEYVQALLLRLQQTEHLQWADQDHRHPLYTTWSRRQEYHCWPCGAPSRWDLLVGYCQWWVKSCSHLLLHSNANCCRVLWCAHQCNRILQSVYRCCCLCGEQCLERTLALLKHIDWSSLLSVVWIAHLYPNMYWKTGVRSNGSSVEVF